MKGAQRSKRTAGTATAKRHARRKLQEKIMFTRTGRDVPLASRPCPTPSKVPYASKPAARVELRRAAGEGVLGRDALGRLPRPYRCVCGRYHLGHLPAAIVKGEATRDDWRRRDEAA